MSYLPYMLAAGAAFALGRASVRKNPPPPSQCSEDLSVASAAGTIVSLCGYCDDLVPVMRPIAEGRAPSLRRIVEVLR